MEDGIRLFGHSRKKQPIYAYTLSNKDGMCVEVIPFGAALRAVHVFDVDGKTRDIVLAPKDIEGCYEDTSYLGVIVGRCANRIACARFSLGDSLFTLAKNNGTNHLHGGPDGFHHVLWQVEAFDGSRIKMTYRSPDGEEGYPGMLDVSVTYTVTADNSLDIEYCAQADADTPVNLTNHAYFNLCGHASGTILGHVLQLYSEKYLPTDASQIPIGSLESVFGTPFDFIQPEQIGKRINEKNEQLANGNGYDHCYSLSGVPTCEYYDKTLSLCAHLYCPESGIAMDTYTTEPGLQLYTGNSLAGKTEGKDGVFYAKRSAVCLEAGGFPNAVNEKSFPDIILKKGAVYRQLTRYHFSARQARM